MRNVVKIFLCVLLLLDIFLLGINVEKVFVGVKYSFRNFQTDGSVIFVDPFNRKMVVYDISSKSVVSSYDYIGSFVISVYSYENGYFIVDRTGQYVAKVSIDGQQLKRVGFQKRIQGSLMQDDKIYILLEGGELHVLDKELNRAFTYKFTGSPAYIFSWNEKVFVTYLWNDNYDIEFINETPKKIGLTTPSILVGDMLIDTRGGQVYNLKTGKITKLSSYISSAYYDGTNYYITSMSNSTVYIVQNDSIRSSFKLPYTPTAVRKVGNLFVFLSAPYNKVMVTTDGKDVKVYETGDYPLEIFSVENSQNVVAVYCTDSGDLYYYYF